MLHVVVLSTAGWRCSAPSTYPTNPVGALVSVLIAPAKGDGYTPSGIVFYLGVISINVKG